jgi:S1-C subfamily serine protease
MIEFACPRCGILLRVKEDAANKKFHCPKCRQRVQAPEANPLMRTMKGIAAPPGKLPVVRRPVRTRRLYLLTASAAVAVVAILAALFWQDIGRLVGNYFDDGQAGLSSSPAEAPKPIGGSMAVKAERELTPREVADYCSASVALVQHRLGSGSGFLAEMEKNQVVLVTNAHVLHADLVQNLKVSFPTSGSSGRPARTALLFEDRRRDLAVLKIETSQLPIRLAGHAYRNGDRVVVIGSPGIIADQLSENAVTDGLLSNVTRLPNGMDFLQISAPVNPGNSGGPILNLRGQVLGVAVAVVKDKQNMNLAVPVVDLRRALEKAARLSDQDHEQTAAEHDAVVILRGVAGATGGYLSGMERYCAAMNAAAQRNDDTDLALHQAKMDCEAIVEKGNYSQLNLIANDIPRVISNRALSERARAKLQDLADVYTEAQFNFRRPHGTVAEISKKALDLRERYTRLVRGLINELDAVDLE